MADSLSYPFTIIAATWHGSYKLADAQSSDTDIMADKNSSLQLEQVQSNLYLSLWYDTSHGDPQPYLSPDWWQPVFILPNIMQCCNADMVLILQQSVNDGKIWYCKIIRAFAWAASSLIPNWNVADTCHPLVLGKGCSTGGCLKKCQIQL